ncbi:hypothetical protein [Enterobacter cloacae]
MALKHIKLSELDDPFEFKTDDEVEDFEDEERMVDLRVLMNL